MAVKETELKEHIRSCLDASILKNRNISEAKIKYIVDLNFTKLNIYKEMRDVLGKEKLRKLSDEVTEINYLLQATWGFPQDKKYHKFWEVPGCHCPVFSNIEIYPSDNYEYSSSCPIHGTKHK